MSSIFYFNTSVNECSGRDANSHEVLSPFAENRGLKVRGRMRSISASEGFCSRRSEGRRYLEHKLEGASSSPRKIVAREGVDNCKIESTSLLPWTLVAREGVEPSRCKHHWFLRPACLPFQHLAVISGARLPVPCLPAGRRHPG